MFTIYVVELSQLKKIHTNIDESYLDALLTEAPRYGYIEKGYYIINNKLPIINPFNLVHVNIFNTFVQLSQRKGQLLQIIKN